MSDPPLTIVVLCTGNRFRSPLAAALLARSAAGLPVEISSAGALDVGTRGILPEAVELGARYGVDLSAHRSHQVRPRELAGIDLALGFEKFHLATAVVDGGAPRDRAFTLPELVGLLALVDPDETAEPVPRAQALIARAGEVRRELGSSGRPPEIADPLGQSKSAQAEIATRVAELTERLAEQLWGRRG
jgi:protein-tyrosine phosphatase